MFQAVLPLSSLVSRQVLTLDLDTRELPLHLHRQAEGYRRLEGAFTLREVVFEVQRMDGGEVSEKEREEAWKFYSRNKIMVTDPDTEKMMETNNKWCVGQPSEQRSTVLHLENPVDVVNNNLVGTFLQKATYLESGKLIAVTTVKEDLPGVGVTLVSQDTSFFEISCPMFGQQFRMKYQHRGNHQESKWRQPENEEYQPVNEEHNLKNKENPQENENYYQENEENYLENGKYQPEDGRNKVSVDVSEISKSYTLTLIQRFEKPLLGLVFIFTTRATRAESREVREGFCVNMHMRKPYTVKPLTPTEQSLIFRLLRYQEQFSRPSKGQQQEMDLAISQELNVEDRMLVQIIQIYLVTVKLTFEFVRRLPGFDTFPNTDQVHMLKAGSKKIIFLWAARCFNPLNDTVVFFGHVAYDLAAYAAVGLDNRDLFQFCRKVHRLAVDPTEFALLTALVMFSDNPVIVMKDQMEQVQSLYVAALVGHVYSRRSSPGVELAGLLGLLQDLRALVEGSKEQCLSDKMKARKLPPLLAELWDIPNY